MYFKSLAMSVASIGLLLFTASVSYSEDEETAPIPGRQLMTEQERDQYRTAMQALETEEERAALRKSHQEELQRRAREQGVEIRDGAGMKKGREKGAAGNDRRRVRGRDLMTPEEKKQHRERMRAASNDEERERLRTENHEKMKARARERGEKIPEEPGPRGGSGKGQGQRKSMGQGGRR